MGFNSAFKGLSESTDGPHARRYMTNYSCQLK